MEKNVVVSNEEVMGSEMNQFHWNFWMNIFHFSF